MVSVEDFLLLLLLFRLIYPVIRYCAVGTLARDVHLRYTPRLHDSASTRSGIFEVKKNPLFGSRLAMPDVFVLGVCIAVACYFTKV